MLIIYKVWQSAPASAVETVATPWCPARPPAEYFCSQLALEKVMRYEPLVAVVPLHSKNTPNTHNTPQRQTTTREKEREIGREGRPCAVAPAQRRPRNTTTDACRSMCETTTHKAHKTRATATAKATVCAGIDLPRSIQHTRERSRATERTCGHVVRPGRPRRSAAARHVPQARASRAGPRRGREPGEGGGSRSATAKEMPAEATLSGVGVGGRPCLA